MLSILLSLADGPVLQTGQTKSYSADGDVVTDGSVKDDGYYHAGRARSYSRRGDVVIDNATGLEWQDDVDSVEKPWVTEENYNDGNYSDTLGDTATTYCSDFSLDGGGWRLPTIQEILTLVDRRKTYPSATEEVFRHISSSRLSMYWSATNACLDSFRAWYVNFGQGVSVYFNKNKSLYVRCVRGERLEPSGLSRDDETDIVTDNGTGLQWQDDGDVEIMTHLWTAAIVWCEDHVTLGGYDDWRLPNINELHSIVDYSQNSPAVSDTFDHTASSWYWSSTSKATYADNAWYVKFRDGNLNMKAKNVNYYVRCVRGGQLNNTINPSIIMYLLN